MIETAAADARHVLIVNSFNHPYSPWSDMAASFRAALSKKSPEPIDLYETSFDTERASSLEAGRPFVNYIHALLSAHEPNLIVPVGAPAAFFMERHREELFPATPVLILGAELRRIPSISPTSNEAAVVFDLDLAAFLENILRVLPETTDVAVVMGDSPIERFWDAEFRRGFQKVGGRVKIEWLNDLTFGQILARASAMPARSAILWTSFSEDAGGVPYFNDGALERLRQVSAAPVFGIGDYELGRGIVGGPLVQTQAAGRESAEVAIRILKGETPAGIHPPPVPIGTPTYDWRELRRWGISEARLPLGSIVEFRQATVWEQYSWQLALVAAIIVAQSSLIAYGVIQGRRRRAAEAEVAEQRREVAHLMRVSTLGELSGAIAHEINQPLTAILSNAQAAQHLLAEESPDLSEIRDSIADIIHEDHRAGEVIARLRNLLKKGEGVSEQVDLNALVNSTLALLRSELISRRIQIETRLADNLPATMGDPVQLQQVLLNLFTNAMDAMASTASVVRRINVSTRTAESGAVEVRIRDRGSGIKPEAHGQLFKPFYSSKENGLGLGLTICAAIVREHGGKLTLSNHSERGAVAALSLPVREFLAAAK